MEEALTKTREVKKLGKTAAERVTARQLGDGGGEGRGGEVEGWKGVKVKPVVIGMVSVFRNTLINSRLYRHLYGAV